MKIVNLEKESAKMDNPLRQLDEDDWMDVEIVVEKTDKDPERHFRAQMRLADKQE